MLPKAWDPNLCLLVEKIFLTGTKESYKDWVSHLLESNESTETGSFPDNASSHSPSGLTSVNRSPHSQWLCLPNRLWAWSHPTQIRSYWLKTEDARTRAVPIEASLWRFTLVAKKRAVLDEAVHPSYISTPNYQTIFLGHKDNEIQR